MQKNETIQFCIQINIGFQNAICKVEHRIKSLGTISCATADGKNLVIPIENLFNIYVWLDLCTLS